MEIIVEIKFKIRSVKVLYVKYADDMNNPQIEISFISLHLNVSLDELFSPLKN
jgi:hypothetical protein